MKVLQVNNVYRLHSTGKITYDIHCELQKQGIESVVCYGRGQKVSEPNVYKFCGEFYSHVNHFIANCTGVLYGGCLLSTLRLISIIKKEKPDIVHLQCLNGYFVNIYRLLNWLKKKRIKTVLTLHAEFMYTGGCGHSMECQQWMHPEGCGQTPCPRYRNDMNVWFFDRSRRMWKRMKAAFEGWGDELIITSVSPWLMQRAAASPMLRNKRHCVVLNGIDTNVFHAYAPEVTQKLREELELGDGPLIFHATAWFCDEPKHPKGGYYLIELAKRMPEVTFVVAGRGKTGISLPPNVRTLSMVTEQARLAQLYAMADLTIITSQKETFSMVVAESLCCGTPVVGFKAGAPEMIALPAYSAFAEYGDVEALEELTREFLSREHTSEDMAKQAFSQYSKGVMTSEYIKQYAATMISPSRK